MATKSKELYSDFPVIYQNALKIIEKRSDYIIADSGKSSKRNSRGLGYVSPYSKLPSPRNLAIVSTKDTESITPSKSLGFILNSSKLATGVSPQGLISPNFTSRRAELTEKIKLLVTDSTYYKSKLRTSDQSVKDCIYTVSKKSTPTVRKYGLTARYVNSTTNLLQTKTNSIEPYRQKLFHIMNEIKKIKSDKIELTRDLATYEASYSIHTELTTKLHQFKGFARSLPDIYANLSLMASKETEILAQINSELQTIHNLEIEFMNSKECKEDIHLEKYRVKLHSDVHKIKTVFTGVRKISGKRCIVSICADSLFRKIEVNITTEEGKSFKKYTIPARSSIINQIKQNKLTDSEIASRILNHMYLLYYENRLNLNYDEDCSVSFFTVCMYIKGLNHEISLILKQEDDIILIILTEPYVEKRVPCVEILKNQNLSIDRLDQVQKVLKSRLKCFQEVGVYSLDWLTHENNSFKEKDSISRLLDVEYINTQIAEETFLIYRVFKKELYNKKLSIKLLRCKEILKFRLKYKQRVIYLEQDTKEFKFLSALQGASLMDSPLTYVKSIEFDKTILKLFK